MKEQMCVIFLYRAFIDSLNNGYESIYLFEFLEVLKLIFLLFCALLVHSQIVCKSIQQLEKKLVLVDFFQFSDQFSYFYFK